MLICWLISLQNTKTCVVAWYKNNTKEKPKGFYETINFTNREQWLNMMQEKYKSFKVNET
jgi:hypothetical protein